MATFELLWADDVPDAVVIDEAVQLAKTLSTDDSPAYVNGVLGAILAAEVPPSLRLAGTLSGPGPTREQPRLGARAPPGGEQVSRRGPASEF